MPTPKNVEINGEKLATILVQRGLGRKDVAKAMRYNDGYITQAISRNTLSNQAVEMLAMKFNINFDDYAPDKQEEQTVIPLTKIETAPALDVDTGKQLIDYFMEKLDHLLNEHTMSLLLIEASVEAALAKKGL